MPAPRTMPSESEIIAYVRQVAAQYGIDPDTMLRIIKGESGFNPASVGDSGHSVGLTQLYDKGLAQDFRQQMGVDPADPANWKQQVEFMARHATQTKGKMGGWEPWHASARAKIGQYEGLPGGQAVGRRDRAGEVAQSTSPLTQPPLATAQQGTSDPQQGWMDYFREFQAKEHPQTLAGLFTDSVGLTKPRDPNNPFEQRPDTLFGALAQGFNKQPTKLEQQVADLNPMAPMSDDAQLKAKQAPATQTVAGALLGKKKPNETVIPKTTQGPTLFSALVGAKKANPGVPNNTLLKALFGGAFG